MGTRETRSSNSHITTFAHQTTNNAVDTTACWMATPFQTFNHLVYGEVLSVFANVVMYIFSWHILVILLPIQGYQFNPWESKAKENTSNIHFLFNSEFEPCHYEWNTITKISTISSYSWKIIDSKINFEFFLLRIGFVGKN